MGCVSAKSKQQDFLLRQTQQIDALQTSNAELQHLVQSLLAENDKLRASQIDSSIQSKICDLEGQIQQLEVKLQEKSKRQETSFSRESEEEAPEILVTSSLCEMPQAEPLSSHSILEDPVVKQLMEKKRLSLFRDMKEGAPASPSNKPS